MFVPEKIFNKNFSNILTRNCFFFFTVVTFRSIKRGSLVTETNIIY